MPAFLSHNKKDKEIAREIAMFLVAEDVNVWFDEWEVSAGDSIVGKIDDGLKDCSHFIILWSANASTSSWVRKELRVALAKAIESGAPRVIPVRLDSTPVPALLADLRYVRYRGGKEDDRREIVQAVTSHGPSASFIRAIVRKYWEVVRNSDKKDTFGLAACPTCGSEKIEPYTDWWVDVGGGPDGPEYSGYEIPSICCLECGWDSPEDGLQHPGAASKVGPSA